MYELLGLIKDGKAPEKIKYNTFKLKRTMSNNLLRIYVDEDGMFYAVLISTKNYHSEYTIKIQDEWLNKPMGKQSYFITHLVNVFNVDDVIRRNNRFLKKIYFEKVIDRIIENIIGL